MFFSMNGYDIIEIDTPVSISLSEMSERMAPESIKKIGIQHENGLPYVFDGRGMPPVLFRERWRFNGIAWLSLHRVGGLARLWGDYYVPVEAHDSIKLCSLFSNPDGRGGVFHVIDRDLVDDVIEEFGDFLVSGEQREEN